MPGIAEDLRCPLAEGVTPRGSRPIKLDANELPFDLPPGPKAELVKAALEISYNRYPDPEAWSLRTKLAERWGVSPQGVLVGNGGDEVLQMLFLAFVAPGDLVLIPNPSFSMFERYALAFRAKLVKVDFSYPQLELRVEHLLEGIERHRPRLVILDNPNNPTGQVVDEEGLREAASLCAEKGSVLVVDEAYGEFYGKSAIALVKEGFENVAVVRTFSKAWGLAALRVGYLLAQKPICEAVKGVKQPFNVNAFSQRAAEIMLRYGQWLESRVMSIVYLRDRIVNAINSNLTLFRARRSQANFVLVETPLGEEVILRKAEEKDIKLKVLKNPFADGCWIRLTVGLEEEMEAFVSLCEELERDNSARREHLMLA